MTDTLHIQRYLGTASLGEASRVGPDGFAPLFCGLGFLLTVATFYPGLATPDALDQFRQGLTGHFSDWHPPIMALWWSVLDRVWPGPQPMLLLQASGFWLGAYLLLDALPPTSRTVRWAAALALLSPAILCCLGVIQKDTQLTAAWALAAAWCFRRRAAGNEPGWMEKTALLVLLGYGALLRQNSALVTGPLALYILSGRPVLARIWSTLACYTAFAVVSVGLGTALNLLLDTDHTHVLRGLLNFDLAGISLRSGSNVFPFGVSREEMQSIAGCYEGGLWHNNFVWGDCSFVWQRGLATPLSDGSYLHAWLAAIAQHPLAYAVHRLAYFLKFSGLVTLQPTRGFWTDGEPDIGLGFAVHHHALFYALKYYVYAGLATPFLRVAFWLGASGALAIWVLRGGILQSARGSFAGAAAILSFLYILSYLPFGLAPDFRYIHVAIVLTTFGAVATAEPLFEAAQRVWTGWRRPGGLPFRGEVQR